MRNKTLKELIEIAREYGVTLSYKGEDGKRHQFKKAELFKRIIEKRVELDMIDLEENFQAFKNNLV